MTNNIWVQGYSRGGYSPQHTVVSSPAGDNNCCKNKDMPLFPCPPMCCMPDPCGCPPPPKPHPDPPPPCIDCRNLVQNPSFEADFSYWHKDNVSITGINVFEGTATASLGPGAASLYQDVWLDKLEGKPLLFSFNAFAGAPNCATGSLIVEITWLDQDSHQIGLGQRLFIPSGRINSTARITLFALTERIPSGAAYARILFSKGQGIFYDAILIDQVVLAAIAGPDLMMNGDFEAGLLGWTAIPDTAFISDHKLSLEGAGHVRTHFNGLLTQDVYIGNTRPDSHFLFSFATGGECPVALNVVIEWLDSNRNVIGLGLNLQIPDGTLPVQENYLSYLNITGPTVPGTVYARIIFTAAVPSPSDYLLLDQVLFAQVATDNLIANPGFEDGLNYWDPTYITLVQLNDVYEGTAAAGIGQIGGALVQDVYLHKPAGYCYLFSTGLGFRRTDPRADYGTMLMKVIWLDHCDNEIGLGLCLIGTSSCLTESTHQWVPYVGVTEPAPPDAVKARIQFTKTSSTNGYIEIDNVVFARLI